GDVGWPGKPLDVYVMGSWSQGSNRKFYGTLAVEGSTAGGTAFSAGSGAGTQLWSGPDAGAAGGWGLRRAYGFPLVAVVYNPVLAAPTVQPHYRPPPPPAHLRGAGAPPLGIL